MIANCLKKCSGQQKLSVEVYLGTNSAHLGALKVIPRNSYVLLIYFYLISCLNIRVSEFLLSSILLDQATRRYVISEKRANFSETGL